MSAVVRARLPSVTNLRTLSAWLVVGVSEICGVDDDARRLCLDGPIRVCPMACGLAKVHRREVRSTPLLFHTLETLDIRRMKRSTVGT